MDVSSEGPIRRQHDAGEEEEGKHAEDAIDKDGHDGFGFFVMRFARDVVGLQDVATDGTEKEGVKELGDEGDLRGAPERHVEAVDFKDGLPAEDTNKNGRAHEEEGKDERAGGHGPQGFPDGWRTVLEGEAEAFDAGEMGPIFAGFDGGLATFVVERGLENPSEKQKADANTPGKVPDFIGGGFQESEIRCVV